MTNDILNDSDYRWIGESLERHLRRYLIQERGLTEPFDGLNEANVVAMLLRAAEGLGYNVWLENRCYSDTNKRADLLLRDPEGSHCWVIEVKVIYDIGDKRSNRKEFIENRDILKDFDLLDCFAKEGLRKTVVWVIFSPSLDVVFAQEGRATLRYGDLVRETQAAFPRTKQAFSKAIDCESLMKCDPAYRFAHIAVWSFN